MGEGHDTLWTRMTLLSPATPWPWSYGILGYKTDAGYELGSVKAYAEVESEVFKLGVGRPPSLRSGLLTFAPRAFNLGWIKKGNPLTLKFECASGLSSAGSAPIDFGDTSTIFTPTVPELPEGNAQPDFTIEDGIAFLLFNFFLK